MLRDEKCRHIIRWSGANGPKDRDFVLVDPNEVARRWGIRKKNMAMNYISMSRSIRQYYKQKIIKKIHGTRYGYTFVINVESENIVTAPAKTIKTNPKNESQSNLKLYAALVSTISNLKKRVCDLESLIRRNGIGTQS